MKLETRKYDNGVFYIPGYAGEVYKTYSGHVYFYDGVSDEYPIEYMRLILAKMEELESENSSNP